MGPAPHRKRSCRRPRVPIDRSSRRPDKERLPRGELRRRTRARLCRPPADRRNAKPGRWPDGTAAPRRPPEAGRSREPRRR